MGRMLSALVVAMLAPEIAFAQDVAETVAFGNALGRAEESFERITDLEVAADGRIVVLDNGDATIGVFDRAGRLLHGFGGDGDGPGEFRYPVPTALTGDTLIVLDQANGRLTSFTLDGSLVGTRRTDFAVGRHGFPEQMWALGDGSLVLETISGCQVPRPKPEDATDTQWRLLVIPPASQASTETAELIEVRREDLGDAIAVYGTGARGSFCGVLPLPFAPSPRAAVGSDRQIAYGTGSVPGVALHRAPAGSAADGAWFRDTPRLVSLPEARRPVTRTDRRAWEQARLAERSDPDASKEITDRFREAIGEAEHPERWAAYDGLVFDSRGDLWIRRPPSIEAAESAWDVLDPDGNHRGTVTLPAALDVHTIVGGTVYGVVKGEWDEDLVRGFSARWD